MGTLSTSGSQFWPSGGSYMFDMDNATNGSGWDLLNVDGEIEIESTSGSPFTIQLVSLTGSNTPGSTPGFDSGSPGTWTVATAGAGIQNYSPGSVVVNTAAFSNAFTGTFNVTTSGNGDALLVEYTPSAPPLIAPQPPLGFNTFGQAGGQITLTFSGTNGQAYEVLASTNLSLPLTNWTVLASGVFGATPVTFTDSVTNAQRFYQLASP